MSFLPFVKNHGGELSPYLIINRRVIPSFPYVGNKITGYRIPSVPNRISIINLDYYHIFTSERILDIVSSMELYEKTYLHMASVPLVYNGVTYYFKFLLQFTALLSSNNLKWARISPVAEIVDDNDNIIKQIYTNTGDISPFYGNPFILFFGISPDGSLNMILASVDSNIENFYSYGPAVGTTAYNRGSYDDAYQYITDPNEQDPGGTSGEGGGDGDFSLTSDIITRPSISVVNGLASMNAGFVTLYKVTMTDLQLLASYLYTDNIWQIVSNYFSHPSDMIAGVLLVPVAVTTGQAYKPKVGLHTFEITLPIVTQQFYDVDMGDLTISEYYGSCFDYAPYTQIEIYLPFIGTRSLDVDEVMGKTLHLSYRIDVLNGDCVATISYYDGLNRSVHYEFSGNCGQQIPVSAQNMDAVVQNAIAFATTAVTAIAGAAGAGAAAAGAATEAGATAAEIETISTAAQASANLSAAGDIAGAGVSAVMNSKAHIERTGNIGSGLGLLSVLTPYIVKKIPRQSLPANYASFEGYPANLYGTLAEFSGYTVVDEIKLQNISATDGELAEIYNILKGGVYV